MLHIQDSVDVSLTNEQAGNRVAYSRQCDSGGDVPR